MASAAESEVGGLFHNGQKSVPLRITLHELGFTQPPTPIKTDNSAAKCIITAIVRQKKSKAMDTRFYWMKKRVKQKDFFVYWKPGSQNMGNCFTKHHPPHHHRKVCATYFYMENALLKIDHKIVHEWANPVLTPVHTVAIMPNRTVLQGCGNVVRMYIRTYVRTYIHTYVRTHKYQNSNVVRIKGAVRGSLSVRKTDRCVAVPQTN